MDYLLVTVIASLLTNFKIVSLKIHIIQLHPTKTKKEKKKITWKRLHLKQMSKILNR